MWTNQIISTWQNIYLCLLISAWQNIYLWLFFHKYTAKTGGICWEGLEDHHIQTRPCNSIEKEQPFCFHLSKSKQRRMQTCCLSWMPWGTFKSPEKINRWCSQWRWVDLDLSSWAMQSTVICWCVVVYQRLLGRSPVVRTCHGLCFLRENVYMGDK